MEKRNKDKQNMGGNSPVEIFADSFELGEFDASSPEATSKAIKKWKLKQVVGEKDATDKEWEKTTKRMKKGMDKDPMREQMMGDANDWSDGWQEVEKSEE